MSKSKARKDWKGTATRAIKDWARRDNKVRLFTRAALDGLEVAALAIEVQATKTEEIVRDVRKARMVLVAGLAAAHVAAAEEFGEEPDTEQQAEHGDQGGDA